MNHKFYNESLQTSKKDHFAGKNYLDANNVTQNESQRLNQTTE